MKTVPAHSCHVHKHNWDSNRALTAHTRLASAREDDAEAAARAGIPVARYHVQRILGTRTQRVREGANSEAGSKGSGYDSKAAALDSPISGIASP